MRPLRLVRQCAQLADELPLALARQAAAQLGHRRGQQDQRRDLGRERLRRHDRDLRTGLEEEHRVCLAGDRRANRIGDRDDRAALLACVARRRDRVGRLARLRHRDDERLLVERRRRVAELRADVPARRNVQPILEDVGADGARVVGRATRDELDALDALESLGDRLELVELDRVVVDAAGDRREQRSRLLVHLLEHEVRRSRPSRQPRSSSRSRSRAARAASRRRR